MPKAKRGGRRSAEEVKAEIDENYGSYYTTLYQEGNVKFIKSNDGAANVPLETRTIGRVYGLIDDNNNLKSISFYDDELLYKTIDIIGRPHNIDGKSVLPHVHIGYPHDSIGSYDISDEDRAIIDKVSKIWYDYLSG